MDIPRSIPEFPAKSLRRACTVKAGMSLTVWISLVDSSNVTNAIGSQLGKYLVLEEVASTSLQYI